jgi:hypothetical protein
MAITCVEPTYVARKKTKIVKRKKKSALLSLHCVSSCALVCVRERARERERERERAKRDADEGRWEEMAGLVEQLLQQDKATQLGLGLALVVLVTGTVYIWYSNRKPTSKDFFQSSPSLNMITF